MTTAPDTAAPVLAAAPRSVVPPAAPPVAAWLSGAALVLFMATGLVSTMVAVGTSRLDLLPDAITRQAFLSGDTMRGIASALAKAPQAKLAARLEREGSYLAIRDFGPQVRQGCNGWLFLTQEIAPQTDGVAHLAARAQVVEQVQSALAKRGIQLLLVMVPDKSRIERDHLCSLRRPASIEPRYSDWLRRMRTAGVRAVDTALPLTALKATGGEPFLRTDTHWTERGAEVSAYAVAEAVRGLGLPDLPPQVWDISRPPAERHVGDLVRLAGIDELPVSLQPASDNVVNSVFTKRMPVDVPGAAPGEADLFGDTALPTIALIGTSYSRNSHFVDYLAHDLGTLVPDLARDGGDFWGAAGVYFAGPAFKDTPPKLVIWEIPERALELSTANEHWVIP